jgi:erythromycin esterase
MNTKIYKNAADLSDFQKQISAQIRPLEEISDLDPLMELIGDSRYVLLGEASHGTHEYYTWRMKLSRRLIREKSFDFIAIEGDWPDCYRANRYVKRYPESGKSAFEVLHAFNRWPTWMWANWEMVAFLDWLHGHNHQEKKKTGFYGLDVYSLWESLDAILNYLEHTDPAALSYAREAMRCFEPYRKENGLSYKRTGSIVSAHCEEEVLELLEIIRNNKKNYNNDHENVFSLEQNALVGVNAVKYYHAMMRGGPDSWNLRDHHMDETLERLMDFHGKGSKCIIWEHNTHLGDARATDMADEGMINLGQLISEKHADKGVVTVGFGSYKGTVTAGRKWGDVIRKINVPEAIAGSWEYHMHKATGGTNAMLLMDKLKGKPAFRKHYGHRAIGVVYQPEYEQYGNYVPSIMPDRYDAFLYIDETHALNPLHVLPDGSQMPETYPFGM